MIMKMLNLLNLFLNHAAYLAGALLPPAFGRGVGLPAISTLRNALSFASEDFIVLGLNLLYRRCRHLLRISVADLHVSPVPLSKQIHVTAAFAWTLTMPPGLMRSRRMCSIFWLCVALASYRHKLRKHTAIVVLAKPRFGNCEKLDRAGECLMQPLKSVWERTMYN